MTHTAKLQFTGTRDASHSPGNLDDFEIVRAFYLHANGKFGIQAAVELSLCDATSCGAGLSHLEKIKQLQSPGLYACNLRFPRRLPGANPSQHLGSSPRQAIRAPFTARPTSGKRAIIRRQPDDHLCNSRL